MTQPKTVDDVVILGGVSIDVDARDDSGYIEKCHAASVVAGTTPGFATGCEYTDTVTGITYINEGTTASCTFNAQIAGQISAADIAPDAVDTSEIAANAVGNSEMADNAIGKAEMADSAVSSAEVEDGTLAPVDQTAAARTRVTVVPFKLPAPTGSNQGPLTVAALQVGQAISVVSVKVVSELATTGSDATNRYEFTPRNVTGAADLHTVATNTQANELAASTPKALTVSQNLAVTANQVLAISASIKDDGSAGPTSLANTQLYAIYEYTI